MVTRRTPPGYEVEKRPVPRPGKNGRVAHPVGYLVTRPDGIVMEFDRRREVDRWFEENVQIRPYSPEEIAMMDAFANDQD